MSLLIFVGIVSLIFKAVSGGKKKKKAEYRRQLLNNQMQMLNNMLKQSGLNQQYSVPSFGNSMVTEQQKENNFSIGWIVFFVVLALILFWLFGPFIQLLSVVGFDNFKDIFFSGKF